eukprot:PLAT15876.1.p1 GENE.PLAT15876.1~~PLAT15876.1.p1  ORF type:complete len:255 (-),score=82.66 PLAT15876.1:147-869(-)
MLRPVSSVLQATAVPAAGAVALRRLSGLVELNDLRDNAGARKVRKRRGRGIGSGLGKTGGYGTKGQRSRGSASRATFGFTGDNIPLFRRLPKRGFTNRQFARPLTPLNLSKLQRWIDTGRIDGDAEITLKTLADSGIVGRFKHGVKLLSRGQVELSAGLRVEVSAASKAAIDAVEAAGGSVVARYHNRLGLRALLKPERFLRLPRQARPPPRLMPFYTDPARRGYLSHRLHHRKAEAEQA